MTQSFSDFVGIPPSHPQQDNLLLAKLVQEARQGGPRGRLAINQLRTIPGGREALQAVMTPPAPTAPIPTAPPQVAPIPVAPPRPAPRPVAPQPPDPVGTSPQVSPSFFDKTIGRGVGAAGRGVLGVGRWSQPVTTPILENLGKAIDTFGGSVTSTVGALTPGDLMGFEKKLAEEREKRGVESRLPGFLQALR